MDLVNVDEAVDSIMCILFDSFSTMVVNKAAFRSDKVCNFIRGNSDTKWFDDECLVKKRDTRKYLRYYQSSYSPQARLAYLRARNDYNELIRNKKKSYNDLLRNKILSAVNKNDNSFWSLLKNKRRKIDEISIN